MRPPGWRPKVCGSCGQKGHMEGSCENKERNVGNGRALVNVTKENKGFDFMFSTIGFSDNDKIDDKNIKPEVLLTSVETDMDMDIPSDYWVEDSGESHHVITNANFL